MQRLEKRLGNIAVAAHNKPAIGLVIAGVLSVVGGVLSAQLPIVADLEKLLPQSFQSVQDLEPLKKRFGGVGHVIFVGLDAEPDKLKQFAEDIAPMIQAEIPGIRYVEYRP